MLESRTVNMTAKSPLSLFFSSSPFPIPTPKTRCSGTIFFFLQKRRGTNLSSHLHQPAGIRDGIRPRGDPTSSILSRVLGAGERGRDGDRTLELAAGLRRRGAGRTEADGASTAPGSPPKPAEIDVAIAMAARVWSPVSLCSTLGWT